VHLVNLCLCRRRNHWHTVYGECLLFREAGISGIRESPMCEGRIEKVSLHIFEESGFLRKVNVFCHLGESLLLWIVRAPWLNGHLLIYAMVKSQDSLWHIQRIDSTLIIFSSKYLGWAIALFENVPSLF